MGQINFKSVGQTRQQRVTNALSSSLKPVGILTPLQPGSDGNIFNMSTSLADQVTDNLRNLILTNWGERVVHYDFGANLKPLLSEMVSLDDFDAEACSRIKGAVDRWLPYISLENFESKIDKVGNASANGLSVIKMTITFNVPALKVFNRVIEVSLYAM